MALSQNRRICEATRATSNKLLMRSLRGLIPGIGDDPRYQRDFRFRRRKPTLARPHSTGRRRPLSSVIVLGESAMGSNHPVFALRVRVGLMNSNPRRLYSPLLRRPVVFMATAVMSSASPASRFRRTIFGSPRWRGSTDCRLSVTMRILIKSPESVESVGNDRIAALSLTQFRSLRSTADDSWHPFEHSTAAAEAEP